MLAMLVVGLCLLQDWNWAKPPWETEPYNEAKIESDNREIPEACRVHDWQSPDTILAIRATYGRIVALKGDGLEIRLEVNRGIYGEGFEWSWYESEPARTIIYSHSGLKIGDKVWVVFCGRCHKIYRVLNEKGSVPN